MAVPLANYLSQTVPNNGSLRLQLLKIIPRLGNDVSARQGQAGVRLQEENALAHLRIQLEEASRKGSKDTILRGCGRRQGGMSKNLDYLAEEKIKAEAKVLQKEHPGAHLFLMQAVHSALASCS
jgi:hypothetical protein